MACQGTQACLGEGEDEAGGEPLWGEVTLWPHSISPHEGPAWAYKVGRKLPSCLRKEGEERTTYSCISDMQLTRKCKIACTIDDTAATFTQAT